MEYRLLLMRMTAQSDVYGLVLSVHLSMEAMPPILVLKNAHLIPMETTILVFVCRPAFSMWFSTELSSILMLKTQLHSVCISVLLVVGLTISPTPVYLPAVLATTLTLQPGNVYSCALQILSHMLMGPTELASMPARLVILHLKWDVSVY